MIEAAEYATPYQRELYEHYRKIHHRLRPPSPPQPTEPVIVPLPTLKVVTKSTPAPVVINPPTLPSGPIDQKAMQVIVARAFGVCVADIASARRTKDVIIPRHVYCYLMVRLTRASYPMIGRWLGGRDHTTIMHAVRKINARIKADAEFRQRVEAIERPLRERMQGQRESWDEMWSRPFHRPELV